MSYSIDDRKAELYESYVRGFKQGQERPALKPLEWDGYNLAESSHEYGNYIYSIGPDYEDGNSGETYYYVSASQEWGFLLADSKDTFTSEESALTWAREQYENFFLSRLNR